MTPTTISAAVPVASNKEARFARLPMARYINPRDGYYFFRIRNKFLRGAQTRALPRGSIEHR